MNVAFFAILSIKRCKTGSRVAGTFRHQPEGTFSALVPFSPHFSLLFMWIMNFHHMLRAPERFQLDLCHTCFIIWFLHNFGI
jgi:hypothetical protein